MNEQYRGFHLYGGCDPVSETLLGRVSHWKPTGCIARMRRNGVITELMRFEFSINCDDENIAKCFGLENARILLGVSFRDFAIARFIGTEKGIAFGILLL